nr:unnamed protein product [Callosobruchus analis]
MLQTGEQGGCYKSHQAVYRKKFTKLLARELAERYLNIRHNESDVVPANGKMIRRRKFSAINAKGECPATAGHAIGIVSVGGSTRQSSTRCRAIARAISSRNTVSAGASATLCGVAVASWTPNVRACHTFAGRKQLLDIEQ